MILAVITFDGSAAPDEPAVFAETIGLRQGLNPRAEVEGRGFVATPLLFGFTRGGRFEFTGFPRLEFEVVTDLTRHDHRAPALGRAEGGTVEHTALPFEVHLEPAAGAQAAHRAIRPGRGKRRQQVDHVAAIRLAQLALQQHFRDARSGTEVAVDLERRMGVEQVGVNAAAPAGRHQEPLENLVGAVAISEARPEVDLPCLAPAGAAVAAGIERNARRLRQLRRAQRGDLAAGMHGEEVRHVAVAVSRVIDVLHPFLELSPFADLRAEQFVSHGGDFRAVGGIDAEFLRSLDVVGEQVPDDLLVIGGTGLRVAVALLQHDPAVAHHRPVLRRPTRWADEFPIGPLDEVALPVFAQLLEHRVGAADKEFAVTSELVVRPEMLAKPGTARAVDPPRRVAGHRVVGAVDDPALVGGDGRLLVPLADRGEIFDPVEKRHVAF